MTNNLLLIHLPSSPTGLIGIILLIVGFGFLYIKAVDHLFRNSELSQESKLIWCVSMAVLPILIPSLYLISEKAKPAN